MLEFMQENIKSIIVIGTIIYVILYFINYKIQSKKDCSSFFDLKD